MHESISVPNRWLEPDVKNPAAMGEILVMDRYLQALPYKAKRIASYLCPVKVNQRDVEALLDSGSTRTLVNKSILEVPQLHNCVLCPDVCVDGDTHDPMVKIPTTRGSFDSRVGLVKNFPVLA